MLSLLAAWLLCDSNARVTGTRVLRCMVAINDRDEIAEKNFAGF